MPREVKYGRFKIMEIKIIKDTISKKELTDIAENQNAIDRAFELLDLTIADSRWRSRLKEIVRTRELLADAMFGGKEYKTSLKDLDRYFFHFALAARINR